MKKKLLSLLLGAAMVLSLAGCGSSETAATAKTETEENAAEEATAEEAENATEAEEGGETKVLKVAMECGYAPYNWTQPDDSNGAVPINDSSDYAYGYDVMIAKKIAETLGYDLQIVKLDWDSLVPAVQSGTIDCVIAGQSITSERLEMVDFSTPYYYASVVGLVKAEGPYAEAKGLSDLKGATCTSQLGTIWYDVCLPQIEDANVQPAQESAPAMLVALESDRTDLIVTDMPTAMAACVAYPDMKILDFTGTEDDFAVSEEEINIGISVQKGNTELLDGINSVLAGMTVEDFDSMMQEAISVQPLAE
ncbi:MAG: transporter substrate-binding domain-containing protein [Suilimivivens sp.]